MVQLLPKQTNGTFKVPLLYLVFKIDLENCLTKEIVDVPPRTSSLVCCQRETILNHDNIITFVFHILEMQYEDKNVQQSSLVLKVGSRVLEGVLTRN